MQCYVYRSSKKLDTYLYVKEKDEFGEVPESLMSLFGRPEFALQFTLTADRSLAREDAVQVIDNISKNGFHLQMTQEYEGPM